MSGKPAPSTIPSTLSVELLQKYSPEVVSQIILLHQKCTHYKDPKDKIWNTTSGKCVTITGKTGQEIIQRIIRESKLKGTSTPQPSPASLPQKSPLPKEPEEPVIEGKGKKVGLTSPQVKWFLDQPIEHYSWEPSGVYHHPIQDKNYLLPNNREFPAWLTREFARYRMAEDLRQSCDTRETGGDKPMFLHQQFIQDYMSPDKPYRGILLNHDLGSGKTRTAISVAEQYRAMGVNVMILLPATLRPNWMGELKTWGNPDIRRPDGYAGLSEINKNQIDQQLDLQIQKGYTFVSYNAANTLEQLKRANGGHSNPITHRLIIVDEVHNLMNMIINPKGRKGPRLYEAMMNVVDCKFLFLSATPLLNTSFELALMFNILKGYMMYKGRKIPLFPEEKNKYESLFVDMKNGKMKNGYLFIRRILGMTSYYYGGEGEVFPTIIRDTNPILCPYTEEHFAKYLPIRSAEMDKEEERKRRRCQLLVIRVPKELDDDDDDVGSTFRVFSRQVSNFAFPPDLTRPYPDMLTSVTDVLKLDPHPDRWTPKQSEDLLHYFSGDDDQLEDFKQRYQTCKTNEARIQLIRHISREQPDEGSTEEIFFMDTPAMPPSYEQALAHALEQIRSNPENFGSYLPNLSPKMAAIFRIIVKDGPQGPCFVYSQFRNMEGIALFAEVLKYYGFEILNPRHTPTQLARNRANRYVIYSGEESPEDRDAIKKIFNHDRNIKGGLCRVFLGTAASAEGITLKNVRQVHIMEPYWNEVRIQQVIGRARRICSHAKLPKEEQNIHVYRYHMTLTPQQKNKIGEELSTDEAIYRIAQRKEKINDQFLQLLKDGAIDCSLNLAHNHTPTNPVNCFSFGVGETGLSFDPEIGQEKMDVAFTAEREILEYYDYKVPTKFWPPGQPTSIDLRWKVTSTGQTIEESVTFESSTPRKIYRGLVYYETIAPGQYRPVVVKITVNQRDVFATWGQPPFPQLVS